MTIHIILDRREKFNRAQFDNLIEVIDDSIAPELCLSYATCIETGAHVYEYSSDTKGAFKQRNR